METYIFEAAKPQDLDAVCSLIQQRIDWMDAVGIRQWNVTKYWEVYPRTYYAEHIDAGRLYVLRRAADHQVVCMAALLEQDPRWTEGTDTPAYYVHHLAADVQVRGAGRTLLSEAEALARRMGKAALRLDCSVDNDVLNRYYESQGYRLAGACIDGVYTGNLREKRL